MAHKRQRATSPPGAQKRSRGIVGASKDIKLGTELPPEDDGDDGSFVPVWKQTVTDERGRRRLHGAFTGGFSAGYFNTVGSKEGWAPKTFVSSRSKRNKDQTSTTAQRPEDFMDEEDLAQAAESRHLETSQSFAGIGDSGGSSTKDDLFGLFMNEEETMGVKIIQKLGWRKNQGIGRKVRRQADLDDQFTNTHDENKVSAHLFAPKDIRIVKSVLQDHRKGLGFETEARLSRKDEDEVEVKPAPALTFLQKTTKASLAKKSAPKTSSFGVGVLNDTGSDDEDPYELGPKLNFNKTLGKEKKLKKPSKFVKPASGERHAFVPKKLTIQNQSALTKGSHDGKPALRGFILALSNTVPPPKLKYSPPKIPHGWQSTKARKPIADPQILQPLKEAAKTSTLDAKARASILGETPLPGKSVFDFISKESRDRLVARTGNANLPQGLGQSGPEGYKKEGQKDLWSFVPILDKDIAAAALAKGATGWMPYAEDVAKRARYVTFLELRAGIKSTLPIRPAGISVSDWAKELEEFAHAAQVFKPASGFMASRFTSSSSSAGLAAGKERGANGSSHASATRPEDPAEQAAKLGMYGAMTRTVTPFQPTRLLCKRFNVAPPANVPYASEGDNDTSGFKTQEPVSREAMDKMVHEVLTQGTSMQRPAWMNPPRPASVPASAIDHAPVDVENNEALLKERAPEDVFKAIFGDDDDDDDDE